MAPPDSGEMKEPGENSLSYTASGWVGRDWSRISECFLSELPPPSPGTELSSLCSHEHQPEFSLLLFSGWRAAEVPNLHSQEKDGSFPAVTAPPLTLQLQPKSCPQEKEHCWGRKRRGLGKNSHTCILLFAFPVPCAQRVAAEPACSPLELLGYTEKNTGKMLEGSSLRA